MDDGSTTHNDTLARDHLLYFNAHAYRLLFWGFVRGGCYQLLKLGTRENYRALLENIARDPAMRHRLWLEALYWGRTSVNTEPVMTFWRG